jgi:N utilization substance protein B
MGKRRKARECALQILFQLDFDDSQPEKIIEQYWQQKKAIKEIRQYTDWLVKGIISHKKDIDGIIQSVSEHWRINRMAVVDRNILRMAVFELLFEQNVAAAIVINEAIEIAKKYSDEQAATFVNGLLDAARKKLASERKTDKEGTDE